MTLQELVDEQRKKNWKWFPSKAEDLQHHVLGLCGETGEVANLIKKWDRGDFELGDSIPVENPPHSSQFDSEITYREIIGEEVIDVLIYVLSICAILGINPDEVLEAKNEFNESRFGAWVAPTDIPDAISLPSEPAAGTV